MLWRDLTPHPIGPTPSRAIRGVRASAARAPDGGMRLAYVIDAEPEAIAWSHAPAGARLDGLWRTTCLEAFVQAPGSAGYLEFNFAPSGAFAAYRFSGYRAGMAPAALSAAPLVEPALADPRHIQVRLSGGADLAFIAAGPSVWGLTAVIEAADGALSYWALAHPPGKPDFHHPSGFVLAV
jgi:hypothetical protein